MSRIIIKNLPSTITEKKLRELFGSKGVITDCQMKYTQRGVFRKFAFIGYKTEESAQSAKEYFNGTFINTSQIQVDISTSLNDPNRPKSWKDRIKGSSEWMKTENADKDLQKKKKRDKSGNNQDIPEELKKDSQFKEFLEVNQDRKSKPLWLDVNDAQSDSQNSSNENDESDDEKLKSLKPDPKSLNETKDQVNKNVQKPEVKKKYNNLYSVVVRKLPLRCKKKDIKQFFQPLKIASLRLKTKKSGFVYVGFKTEKDMKQALLKNKGFCGGHRVDVTEVFKKVELSKNSFQVEEDQEKNLELIAETGKIYVRNLCYTVTEEEIEELFSKYGQIAEISLPMDLFTHQAKGFAFVSYVFAEHAVKAFSELDGALFQGRLLHLIPAKPTKEFNGENEMNYKKKKETQMKELSGSSHNWNILFLGMNAVADVISEKYNVEKSKLLSGDTNESVAVRMALAETQLVMEARKFLVDNGVELDAFSQAAAERSKTVIVVKQLPAKTDPEELRQLFSKYGDVSRVILPPSGMIALVEFHNQSEAKSAFSKLAYTRFHQLPLYLEWAPINGLKEAPPPTESEHQPNKTEDTAGVTTAKEEEAASDDEEPPPGTTVFVKGISFNTTQEAFRKHFEKCGPIHHATISMKKDLKTGKMLSMGYGFVQFKNKASAVKCIQNLQLSLLEDRSIELKFSNRAALASSASQRKKSEVTKQLTSRILVRNIPFEASEREVKDLFKEFGTLKFVRLPKKIGGSGQHRGFGFVEYVTKNDAKRAFEALCHSTHLFGRRLVLDWAKTDSEDVSELRKKTARDFVGGGPQSKLKKTKLNEDVLLASARNFPEE